MKTEMDWITNLEETLRADGEDGFFTVRYYQSVDSTNEEAKRAAAGGAGEGLVIIGEEQTAGRGRRGRDWASPAGESVYMTLLLRPPLPADRTSMLTLVMGFSAARAAREVCGREIGIKWPNDIVIDGRKICGILTEARVESGSSRADYVAVGIGINVNNSAFPAELSDRAVSLRQAAGRTFSRAAVTAAVLRHFHANYGVFLKTGDLSGLIGDYEALLVNRGKMIRVEDPSDPHTGTALGIDASGALLVRRDDGGTERVTSGEVSVRGIYGYV